MFKFKDALGRIKTVLELRRNVWVVKQGEAVPLTGLMGVCRVCCDDAMWVVVAEKGIWELCCACYHFLQKE